MSTECDKAVILAAGLGSRMRREDSDGSLIGEQASVAASGVKALIPFERPFLDYLLGNLAEAGFRRICLVIGPGHDALREHCQELDCQRITISFAIQDTPKGTADAVLAAEAFADDDFFVVMNSDNLYPVPALRSLRMCEGAGTIGFDSRTVYPDSQTSPERVAAAAIMKVDNGGFITEIVEKPPVASVRLATGPLYVSMNCWRFSSAIFEACRNIPPSSRGEYEIPGAVDYSIRELGERYRVVFSNEEVPDLSSRSDVPHVARLLSGREVRL